MKFRSILVLPWLGWPLACFAAHGVYPDQPVRVLVPTPADSTADIVTRLVAPGLSAFFAQPFLVDNRSGANGMLGIELAAKATPDGHTLVVGTPGMLTTVQHGRKQVPYDTLRDFAPIGLIALGPYLLVTHPSVPARSVSELIAFARAHPGKLAYASTGNGSTNHMALELFKGVTGVDIRHVPTKSVPQAVADVVAGQAQLSMLSIAPLLPHLKAQRLRALAVAGANRAELLPQVPTVHEAGVKGFEAMTWFGLLVASATPKPVVARISAGLQKVVQQPEIRKQLQGAGTAPANGDPAELERLIRRELELYAKLARSAGIRAD